MPSRFSGHAISAGGDSKGVAEWLAAGLPVERLGVSKQRWNLEKKAACRSRLAGIAG